MDRFASPLRPVALLGMALVLLVAGCGPPKGEAPDLMRFRNTDGTPDEFLVNPARPLEDPPELVLPPPTPGATNRAEPRPVEAAVTALGGSTSAMNRDGIPGGDGAVVAHVGRFGSDPAIRETLRAEDIEYRRRNNMRVMQRVANQNGYFRAYSRQSLDQQAEMDRLRASGVRVPSAPPKEILPE